MVKNERNNLNETALEALFEAGRQSPAVPSEQLLTRIMADAEAELAGAREVGRRARPRWRAPVASIIAALGGWPAMAGMVTATLAGIWIGFSQPATLETVTGGLMGSSGGVVATDQDLDALLPSAAGWDGLLGEG